MSTCRLLQETVNIKTACEMLECSTSYLYKLRKAGKLPNIKHAGKVRFYIEDIDYLCDKLRQERATL